MNVSSQVLAFALMALGIPMLAVAQSNGLSASDKAFVQAASMSNSTEIDAAKLASKQSQDKHVKEFAHHTLPN